jgi:hypothetical protein
VSYPERTIAQFLPNLREISDWAKNTKKSPKRKSLISPCSSRFNQINFYGSFNSYHSTNQRKKNEQNWTQVNETKKQKKNSSENHRKREKTDLEGEQVKHEFDPLISSRGQITSHS